MRSGVSSKSDGRGGHGRWGSVCVRAERGFARNPTDTADTADRGKSTEWFTSYTYVDYTVCPPCLSDFQETPSTPKAFLCVEYWLNLPYLPTEPPQSIANRELVAELPSTTDKKREGRS